MTAETLNNVLGYVSAAGASGCWLSHPVAALAATPRCASFWAALCFGALGAVALAGQILPETATDFEIVAQRVLVVVLVLFRNLLFKFTSAFDPSSRRPACRCRSNGGPDRLDDRRTDFRRPASTDHRVQHLPLRAVLQFVDDRGVQGLWRAGRDQPSVARNRMRMLSLAACYGGDPPSSLRRTTKGSRWRSALGDRKRVRVPARTVTTEDRPARLAPSRAGTVPADAIGGLDGCDDAGGGRRERAPADDQAVGAWVFLLDDTEA